MMKNLNSFKFIRRSIKFLQLNCNSFYSLNLKNARLHKEHEKFTQTHTYFRM